jgi:hypothetical protein
MTPIPESSWKKGDEPCALATHEFQPKGYRKHAKQNAKYKEVDSLSDAQRGEFQGADGLANRIVARSKRAENDVSDDENYATESRHK